MTDGFISAEIARTRGKKITMEAAILAATTEFSAYGTRGEPATMRLEIWRTRAGAYVAVTRWEAPGGRTDVRAIVVKPDINAGDAEQAMRDEVMEFFDYEQRAMKMARKQLGWSFIEEVE